MSDLTERAYTDVRAAVRSGRWSNERTAAGPGCSTRCACSTGRSATSTRCCGRSPPLASAVKAARQPAAPDNPFLEPEKGVSDGDQRGPGPLPRPAGRDDRSAVLPDFGRAGRDWAVPSRRVAGAEPAAGPDPRELPAGARDALAAIGTGGYPEAVALHRGADRHAARRIPARTGWSWSIAASARTRCCRKLTADDARPHQGRAGAVVAELEPERGLRVAAETPGGRPGTGERLHRSSMERASAMVN